MMDRTLLTPDESAVAQRFVARRKRWSKGWARLRYFSLVGALFLIASSVHWFYSAVEYTESNTLLLTARSETQPVTKSDLASAMSDAKSDASLLAKLWIAGAVSLFVGLHLVGFTLSRWNRHVEDRIIEKLVNALLSSVAEE